MADLQQSLSAEPPLAGALERSAAHADESREQADRANRAKDDFIATISHELRTPLQAILTRVPLLSRSDLPEPVRAEGLAIIERSARMQQRLNDDLLDMSRMLSGKLRMSMRPVELKRSLAQAIEAVRPAAIDRQLELAAQLDADIGVVEADPDRLQQLLWNLVSNAVKFTPSGGRVSVRAYRVQSDVRISVSDTGVGIAGERLERIFERFHGSSGVGSRRYGGLGLGLAIARQLAELHGGRIQAASDGVGRGASFTVTLPLPRVLVATEGPARCDAALAEPAGARTRGRLRGCRLLLVEDEQGVREGLKRLLSDAGASVVAVDSARAALDAYVASRPDLLVSDIALPGLDGYQLLQELRALEREQGWPRVPAMAVTALVRENERATVLRAGYQGLMHKPLESQRLIDGLVELLLPSQCRA